MLEYGVDTEITAEELEAAMAANVDAHGNDLALERATAAMSPEQRERSDENLCRFIVSARKSLVGEAD